MKDENAMTNTLDLAAEKLVKLSVQGTCTPRPRRFPCQKEPLSANTSGAASNKVFSFTTCPVL